MSSKLDEAEIRKVIENWVQGVRAKDLAAVAANHTDDVVMFDVPPPVALRGIDAYRKSWPQLFEWQRSAEGSFEIHTLDVTAGSDVAFATAILLCASKEARSKDSTPTLRLTIGLRKDGGRWRIAHEHHSFPLQN
jgi:uncharacterized protein (TIGR02246 family)